MLLSLSTALPLHVASGELFFFFFSFSQHLNLEKSNLEILWKVKMSSVCFRACSLGSDSMCCSGDGWQQHGKLCTGLVKSRPSKEKERQASHYPRRQPQSPEGRELEQVLLCAMGIETVLPSLWSFMYWVYIYMYVCVYVYMCVPLNKPVLHETGWLKGRSRRNMSYLSNEQEIMGI